MKLIKNSKTTRFPRSTKNVKSTLNKAMDIAQKEGWTRVIVIGEGKDRGKHLSSPMIQAQFAFMLETAKYLSMKDYFG